ncbi:MAG: hypothetical protein OCD01_19565 [Fibrobacterales bacterium]
MKVKNIPDTSKLKCNCEGGWIEHWEKHTKQFRSICSHIYCDVAKNLFGAHVEQVDTNDKSAYIIPLCPKHNNHDFNVYFDIKRGVKLAPAVSGDICKEESPSDKVNRFL